jgi:uncharacterized protein Usg
MIQNFHFFTVFNPLLKPTENYLTQAHEFHHLLKKKVESEDQKAHLYWGKIKKSNQNQSINIEDYKKIVLENKRASRDTHLFISDFNFFWVAKVEEVTTKRPKSSETLSIYETEDVEIWFKIKDMDLLCDHPCATKEHIAKLSSGEFKSLNPHLPGLRYPLIVDDLSMEMYFRKYRDQKRILLENPLLEMKDIQPTQISYTIPQSSFDNLPDLLKKKIVWSEDLFANLHEKDSQYQQKLSSVAFSYLEILEALLNNSLMKEIELRVGSKKDFYTLPEMYRLLNQFIWNGYNIDELMMNTLHDEFWRFCKIDVRNFLHQNVGTIPVHSVRAGNPLSTGASLYIRNSMLGVGCKGILNEILNSYRPIEKSRFAKAG